jgi:hypothetical protein
MDSHDIVWRLLADLRDSTLAAALILRREGKNEAADNLCMNVGYAIGVASAFLKKLKKSEANNGNN